ncbi:hypothetical protein [Ancylobacter polymorphus]|uniref:Phage tail collar domain-containing protein n=1 Tax=Ancylobacter polymorphus TaxID=223390 RepID=A0ABU0BBL3_9HYPH|nr:hypothetical protein [Ancylobacter polymorphus]MDQ0302989.1 hypothetical protein [Ancylobacter polymorphus]
MIDRTVRPKWRLTRVAQEDDDLKLTCVGQTEPALEITTDGKTTLNTSLTVKGPLTLSQPISGDGGTVKVAGGLTVTGPVEVPGGITGPGAVPRGVILMWGGGGDPGRPPEGLALCDGRNGTPDRRARFPVGADSGAFPANQAGGTVEHIHRIDHVYHLGAVRNADGKEFGVVSPHALQRLTCDTQHAVHFPPYLALHFIMKL